MPYLNPFRTLKVPTVSLPDLHGEKLFRVSRMKLDKKTGTVEPVYEAFDLQPEIDACQELAGVDYMKKLLKTGQATPEDFYDDGKSGIDNTLLPKTVHEAKALADQNNAQIAELCKTIGVPEGETLTGAQLESYLKDYVRKQFEAYQAEHAKEATANE